MSDQLKTLLRRGLTAHEGNRPEEAEKIYRAALAMSQLHWLSWVGQAGESEP